MPNEHLKNAYDALALSEAQKQALYARIEARSNDRRRQKKRLRVRRALLLLAAVVALLAGFAVSGVAGYRKWSLGAPQPYANAEAGAYDVHSQVEYPAAAAATGEDAQPDADAENETGAEAPLTDEALLQKAAQILTLVGLQDTSLGSMTLTRQTNQRYGREEAEITYTQAEYRTSVCLQADTGALLSLSSIDWIEQPMAVACQTQEQAEQLARSYYELLPVQQGYVCTGCTQYDEQYWSFEFCREIEPGLYNTYEMARITVNPVSGRLTGVNMFCFPLLDDHAPGDEPLTQAQAEAIAEKDAGVNTAYYTLKSAEVMIVLPNWFFTEYMADSMDVQFSTVTRLAWRLTYENTDGEFVSERYVDVDYYTGEILGGDTT